MYKSIIMTNVKKIELLSQSYCDKIIKFLIDNELESIEFINPIVMLIDMKNNENSVNVIPCVTQFIDRDGIVGGVNNDNEPIDWKLSDMSVEELAYILDIMNTQEFYEYVDDDNNQIETI
jgi:hypothetical protein